MAAERPVYVFAHRANDVDDIRDAIQHGANAIEVDLHLCGGETRGEVNHDGCAGSTTLAQWLSAFNDAPDNSRIAAIAFDVKATADIVSKSNMDSLVAAARSQLPSDVLVIYGVGRWKHRSNLSHITPR